MLSEIIVATGNKGKLAEIKTLFNDMPVVLTSLRDYWDPIVPIPEEGETFYQNAFGKATWVFSRTESRALRTIPGLKLTISKGNRDQKRTLCRRRRGRPEKP